MPMVPRAVLATLACARLGAVHSVVFGGFASHELAIWIEDARPKAVVSASSGIEVRRVVEHKPLFDGAIEESSHEPDQRVIVQRPQVAATMAEPRDVDRTEARDRAEPADCVPVAATDPLHILYTSGTTGRPKAVVRGNGGHAVASRWSMTNITTRPPGGGASGPPRTSAGSSGHSDVVYAPLLAGCTPVLHEGKPVGTPDAGPSGG